ncbi:hypothetical protein MIZ01_2066 [Sideroxyarcus emersonii]|uniref:Uncharacterized protein n=1 Tax=Sideroxyarcus emersonii TaxID=2764705 RepID=A0AAN1XBI4_9PROT|nr:hypothetical protein [Sideroxyarcus emersonii]BCK88264.1 hypothetical protein MIZ01_2066 [Sideroxyarcus emersonii]
MPNASPIRVIIELAESGPVFQRLTEATQKTVGNYTAHRHQPHFQGGEIHGHCDLPGGRQVSWTATGHRLHPNKFPADNKIPNDAKAAVATVLGVSTDLLECYSAFSEFENQEVFVVRKSSRTKSFKQFLREGK